MTQRFCNHCGAKLAGLHRCSACGHDPKASSIGYPRCRCERCYAGLPCPCLRCSTPPPPTA